MKKMFFLVLFLTIYTNLFANVIGIHGVYTVSGVRTTTDSMCFVITSQGSQIGWLTKFGLSRFDSVYTTNILTDHNVNVRFFNGGIQVDEKDYIIAPSLLDSVPKFANFSTITEDSVKIMHLMDSIPKFINFIASLEDSARYSWILKAITWGIGDSNHSDTSTYAQRDAALQLFAIILGINNNTDSLSQKPNRSEFANTDEVMKTNQVFSTGKFIFPEYVGNGGSDSVIVSFGINDSLVIHQVDSLIALRFKQNGTLLDSLTQSDSRVKNTRTGYYQIRYKSTGTDSALGYYTVVVKIKMGGKWRGIITGGYVVMQDQLDNYLTSSQYYWGSCNNCRYWYFPSTSSIKDSSWTIDPIKINGTDSVAATLYYYRVSSTKVRKGNKLLIFK